MIYQDILDKKRSGKKQLAVLIDPDKTSGKKLYQLLEESLMSRVDYFFVGGSLMTSGNFESCIDVIKEISNIPVIIFPGSPLQVSPRADGILFISLISGRNAEALIGHHVIAAPYIKRANLEVLPTGYILVETGKPTTVSYMSHTLPVPGDKYDIAACTALAGEMLGLKLIYLDAGSGAPIPVNAGMIATVKNVLSVPLITGGGIKNSQQAFEAYRAGADLLVVGNVFEKNPGLINEISEAAIKTSTLLKDNA